MKEQITKILQDYVQVFGYLSVDEYISTRKSLLKDDMYDDYVSLRPYSTIITLGLAYPSKTIRWQKKGTGLLSKYSYGIDYHKVFKTKLEGITKELESLGIKSLSTVDTGTIDERWASYVANMGFLGKNQFLIDKKYGGYLYLATILVDVDIEKNIQLLDTCGTCRKCIDACPSNALNDNLANGFIREKCISFLTQEKKAFNELEISYIKTMVYGCDICQVVCPKNKGIDFHIHPEFEATGIESVDLRQVLGMSNKEYMNVYGDNASSWKGALVIKRNALAMIANHKLVDFIPLIKESALKYKDVLWYNKTASKVVEMLERK